MIQMYVKTNPNSVIIFSILTYVHQARFEGQQGVLRALQGARKAYAISASSAIDVVPRSWQPALEYGDDR